MVQAASCSVDAVVVVLLNLERGLAGLQVDFGHRQRGARLGLRSLQLARRLRVGREEGHLLFGEVVLEEDVEQQVRPGPWPTACVLSRRASASTSLRWTYPSPVTVVVRPLPAQVFGDDLVRIRDQLDVRRDLGAQLPAPLIGRHLAGELRAGQVNGRLEVLPVLPGGAPEMKLPEEVGGLLQRQLAGHERSHVRLLLRTAAVSSVPRNFSRSMRANLTASSAALMSLSFWFF